MVYKFIQEQQAGRHEVSRKIPELVCGKYLFLESHFKINLIKTITAGMRHRNSAKKYLNKSACPI